METINSDLNLLFSNLFSSIKVLRTKFFTSIEWDYICPKKTNPNIINVFNKILANSSDFFKIVGFLIEEQISNLKKWLEVFHSMSKKIKEIIYDLFSDAVQVETSKFCAGVIFYAKLDQKDKTYENFLSIFASRFQGDISESNKMVAFSKFNETLSTQDLKQIIFLLEKLQKNFNEAKNNLRISTCFFLIFNIFEEFSEFRQKCQFFLQKEASCKYYLYAFLNGIMGLDYTLAEITAQSFQNKFWEQIIVADQTDKIFYEARKIFFLWLSDAQENRHIISGFTDLDSDENGIPDFQQVINHIKEIFPEKIYVFPFIKDLYAFNFVATGEIFISDYYKCGKNIRIQALLLALLLFRELSHKKRTTFREKRQINSTPEKFFNESGRYNEFKVFGMYLNDFIGRIINDEEFADIIVDGLKWNTNFCKNYIDNNMSKNLISSSSTNHFVGCTVRLQKTTEPGFHDKLLKEIEEDLAKLKNGKKII